MFGKNNYKIIPNMIDTDKFLSYKRSDSKDLLIKYSIDEDVIVLGHVGRYSPEKNQSFLFEIAEILHSKGIKYKMFLIGANYEKLEVTSEFKNNDNIIILDPVHNIESYYSIFDFLLLPSLHEGFGNVALEAQLLNKRVIVSEFVPSAVDLEMGLLKTINIDCAEEWVNTIMSWDDLKLYDKKDIEKSLRKKGFDNNKITKIYEKIYLS